MKKLKKVFKSIVKIYTKIAVSFFRSSKTDVKEFFMAEICKSMSNNSYDFSYRMYPKNRVVFDMNKKNTGRKFAIVLQGPIRTEDDFTVNTISYYRQIYPDAFIIVSTWNDQPQQMIQKLRDQDIHVVLCEKPESSGQLNINFQLKNSFEGIKYAAELGAEYILKSRTDQCIAKENVMHFFIDLLHQFPSAFPNVQDKRLIALSLNYGNMFYPYFISDFVYFGTTKEMLTLFSIPLDTRQSFPMPMNATRRMLSESLYAPEVYIVVNYLKALGHNCDFSVKDYWNIIKDYFICVDRKTVDLIWPKYDGKYKLHRYYGDYFNDDSFDLMKTKNFDFINWFSLYSGSLQYINEYEKYADVKFK